MAEEVFPTINQCIDAFTNEKDEAIVTIKKITDVASNREHYNDTYEDIKYSFEELYAIVHAMEDAEDAEKIVTKLEELVVAEKPFFDHFNAYGDEYDRILYPWDNPEPDRCETREDERVFYQPGYIDDLFKEPHNLAWANAGDYLYNKFPSIRKRVWKVISQVELGEWTGESLGWNPPEAREFDRDY